MEALEGVQAAVAGIAEQIGPKVVGVGPFGSGVVVADGAVLTNAHVVRREQARVRFPDGRTETAPVAGVDLDGDVAVVSVDTGGIAPIEWNGGAPALGAAVFAVANPGGRGLHVTLGLVSATGRSFRGPRGRRISGSIEHTAPLVRGSSGSPIVDGEGRLLGLNTLRREGGLILALAADTGLRQRVDSLARGESPSRPVLGVALAPSRVARRLRGAVGLPERDGLLVRGVVEGGPAERAGIEQGDLIVAVAGAPVARIDDLHEALDRAGTGATLELAVVRGLDERTVEVSLG
jgi:S1-C subfamily serine protease